MFVIVYVTNGRRNNTISKNLLNNNIIDLLVESRLTGSKSEARRLIEQNGISLNQEKISSINQMITDKDNPIDIDKLLVKVISLVCLK